MKITHLFGLMVLGLALTLPTGTALAEDEIMVLLRPVPGAAAGSKPKEIVVVGSKAYEVGARGARTPLSDGRYPTMDNRMIIIVGGKVAPQSTAGLPTGKRQHKPVGLGQEHKTLNPQPLPPKAIGPNSALPPNPAAAKGLNPQPLPPKPAQSDEMEKLKLQAEMQKKTQATSTTSNLLKKQQQSQQDIIQNLK